MKCHVLFSPRQFETEAFKRQFELNDVLFFSFEDNLNENVLISNISFTENVVRLYLLSTDSEPLWYAKLSPLKTE